MDWWQDRQESERAWKVDGPSSIQRRRWPRHRACNLDLKNPMRWRRGSPPALEIVEAITAREREIIAIMDDIRAELAEVGL
ncbi:MAG: hypothetical protein R3D80_21110 [Paracoccaceae bacterium]